MPKTTTRLVLAIEASSDTNAAKIKEVLQNIVQNVGEDTFCNVLYPKIRKNPAFFAKVANNSLIKML